MNHQPHPLRNAVKRVLGPVLKPVAGWYANKTRQYSYLGTKAEVHPGVFHPGLFLSTKILGRYLQQQQLQGKRALELGCGSGWLSAFMAVQGASVTASDINPAAVKNAAANASLNAVQVEAVQSDLFAALAERQFELLVINPPYYPKAPETDAQHAWYCGPEFEYFKRLLAELPAHIAPSGRAIMILSEDCALDKIESIAQQHNQTLHEIHRERRLLEWNFIFEVVKME